MGGSAEGAPKVLPSVQWWSLPPPLTGGGPAMARSAGGEPYRPAHPALAAAGLPDGGHRLAAYWGISVDRWLPRGRRGRRVVIGSRLRTATQRVHRRFQLEEMLVRGRLALVGIDQLTGGLDKPGDTLVATNRLLLGHDISLADPRTPPAVVPDERPNHAS